MADCMKSDCMKLSCVSNCSNCSFCSNEAWTKDRKKEEVKDNYKSFEDCITDTLSKDIQRAF